MVTDGESGEAASMVHIRCSNGSKFSVPAPLGATVGMFKSLVAASCDLPADQQRLIYKGRILKDDQTLESYGVESDHTIHLVRCAPPPSADYATANIGVSENIPGAAGNNGSSEGRLLGGAGFGGSLFPGLGDNGPADSGAFGLLGTGLPELSQVQEQLIQNPNTMRDMMNMPILQNLLNNPDLLRSLIMNNPQMREIIDRNPDLAHVLNDPSTLRQTLEAARNPELMREMMRNTDRAMSNIESSPEGFNMLRRMYENVQEPLLNATTMAGETGRDLGSDPLASMLGTQVTTQSRDRSTNTSTSNIDQTAGFTAPNTSPLPNPWGNTTGGAQPANTRSTPSGLGGLGIPELERMVNGMQDSSFVDQLQSPAVAQLMQSLLSNPQYLHQMHDLLDNTQLRELLQNPDMLRQLASPQMMQQLSAFQQQLQAHLGRQPTSEAQNQAGGAAAMQNNMGMELLMSMLSGRGTGGHGSNLDVAPEELYATQLSQLQEMGFFDTQENIRALSAAGGNVHVAVERLLGNSGL